MLFDTDDPTYQAGYRHGFADAFGERDVPPKRRYLAAAGTLAFGLGTATAGAMLFTPRYHHMGAILTFSATVLGSVLGAAHILVDKDPKTPRLGIRI